MDAAASRVDGQFLVGNNLMVAPIVDDEGDRKVYLPNGLWYDFFDECRPPKAHEKSSANRSRSIKIAEAGTDNRLAEYPIGRLTGQPATFWFRSRGPQVVYSMSNSPHG